MKDPVVCGTSLKITDVVHKAFKTLNISSKKNWSGFDFFGLTRPDTLKVISIKKNNQCDDDNLAKS